MRRHNQINANVGSPSEAMLEMLRKHKQDVHRIANLAAEISSATETGVGINSMLGRGRGMHVQQLQGVSPTSTVLTTPRVTSPMLPSRLASSSKRSSSPRLPSPLNANSSMIGIGSPSSSKQQRLPSPLPHSSSKKQSEPKKGVGSKLASSLRIEDQSSNGAGGNGHISPEQKQKKMRHAVHDLYQTVQDQRTRAEARGLTLPRALYRLSSLLATNRPGNHALTRIKDALSENEEAITNLTNKFTAYKFDTQQDLAQKTMTKFFRGVGKRSKTNAFLIWKQEAITARPDVELEAMKSKLREQQTILLKKFIKSLQSNVVSKNFTRWASYVAQKKSELELLNKTIAEREEKRKQLITRTLRRITHQCLSRGFQSWYNSAQEQRVHRQNLNRAVGRWKFRKAAGLFSVWQDYVLDRLHNRALILKILKRVDNMAISKGMSKWRGYLMELKQIKIQKEQLLMKLSNNLTSADDLKNIIKMVMHETRSLLEADSTVLYLYDETRKQLYTNDKRRNRDVQDSDSEEEEEEEENFVFYGPVKNDASIPGHCFRTKELISLSNAYEDDRFSDTLRSKERSSRNRTKQVLCVPLRIDPQSPTLGVLHLVNTRHGHAFSLESEQMVVTFATQIAIAIAAVHLNENVKTVKMTRFIKRYQNLLLTKTYNTWYGVWNNAKRLRNVQFKAMKMMKNRYLSKAYATLLLYYQNRKRQREITARIISRLLNTLLHRGFQRWSNFVLKMQIAGDAQHLYQQLQDIKQQHQDDIIKKAIRRLQNRRMASAYQTWFQMYEATKAHKVALKRTMARWTKASVVRTFEALCTYTMERQRARQLIFKVLGRVDNYAIYRGFSKWRDYIKGQIQTQMAKVNLISKMSQGLFNQKDVSELVQVVMRQACDLLDADRATLFVVRKVQTKNKKNSTTSTYKKELYTFAADGVEPIIIPYTAGLVGVCVAQGGVLNIGDAYKDDRFNRDIDRRSGYHTRQVLCAPIFSSFSAASMNSTSHTGGSGINALHKPAITGVLQVLNRRSKVGQEDENTNGFTLQDEELITGFTKQISIALDSIIKTNLENDVKVRRFYQKYQNRFLAKSWNTWHHFHLQCRSRKHSMNKSFMFWQKQKYAKAWIPWVTFVQNRQKQRNIMVRTLKRMERMRLHKGFSTWNKYSIMKQISNDMMVTMHALEQERQRHREAIMKRALRRMRYAAMNKVLNQWLDMTLQAQQRRLIVKRAAARFQKRLLHKAFASIEDYATTRIYQRQLVTRVLQRVDNFALHKAFSTFKAVIANDKKMQLHREQLLLGMANGMATAKDMKELILLTMHQAKELVGADRASLFLIHPDTKESYTYVADSMAEPITIKQGEGLIGTCIESGVPLNIHDARHDKRFHKSHDRKTGYTTKEVLCVPLVDTSGAVLGAIQVINRNRASTSSGFAKTSMGQKEDQTNEQHNGKVDDGRVLSNPPKRKKQRTEVEPFTAHELSCLERMGVQVQLVVQDILTNQREGKFKLHRFVQRWTKQSLNKMWNHWDHYVRAKKRMAVLTARCVVLWQKRSQRQALNSWIQYWEERVWQRNFMKRVFSRMTKMSLNRGFQSWYRFSHSADFGLGAAAQQVCVALDSTSSMLNASTTMEDACSLVKSAACQLLRASSATLYLVDQQRMLAWAYVSNSSELHRIPFGHGIVGRMAQGSDRSNGGSKAASSLVYNSSEEEDASVLCIGITDTVNESITAVLDVRRPRWSPQDKSLPFTEHDECVAISLGHTAGALIDHVQQKETQGALTTQLHNAALAEEKMASIITWLFEVIGSGDSDEHREEIEEMRDTFIRAHYGSRQQVEEMQILEDGAQTQAALLAEQKQYGSFDENDISSLQHAANVQQHLYQQSHSAPQDMEEHEWSRAFAEADLDHDGSLSPAEFRQFYASRVGGGR